MNCADFQSHLEQSIELRIAPAAELQQHGERCPQASCREVWEDFQLVESAIQHWCDRFQETPIPSKGCSQPIRPTRKFPRTVATMLMLASACLLVAVTFSQPRSTSVSSAGSAVGFYQNSIAFTPKRPTSPHNGRRYQGIEPSEAGQAADVHGLSIDWIAVTPLQLTSSMAYVLLGNGESASEKSASESSWIDNWPEQLKPISENFEAIRSLLIEQRDNQTLRFRSLNGCLLS